MVNNPNFDLGKVSVEKIPTKAEQLGQLGTGLGNLLQGVSYVNSPQTRMLNLAQKAANQKGQELTPAQKAFYAISLYNKSLTPGALDNINHQNLIDSLAGSNTPNPFNGLINNIGGQNSPQQGGVFSQFRSKLGNIFHNPLSNPNPPPIFPNATPTNPLGAFAQPQQQPVQNINPKPVPTPFVLPQRDFSNTGLPSIDYSNTGLPERKIDMTPITGPGLNTSNNSAGGAATLLPPEKTEAKRYVLEDPNKALQVQTYEKNQRTQELQDQKFNAEVRKEAAEAQKAELTVQFQAETDPLKKKQIEKDLQLTDQRIKNEIKQGKELDKRITAANPNAIKDLGLTQARILNNPLVKNNATYLGFKANPQQALKVARLLTKVSSSTGDVSDFIDGLQSLQKEYDAEQALARQQAAQSTQQGSTDIKGILHTILQMMNGQNKAPIINRQQQGSPTERARRYAE